MNKKKVSIYCACHKPKYIKFNQNNIRYIEVGASLRDKHFLKLTDASSPDNISHKNKDYNELTAQYYCWKNDHESDIVGLCHYRRLFVTKEIWEGTHSQIKKALVRNKDIVSILKDHDIIVVKRWYISPNKPLINRIGVKPSGIKRKNLDLMYQTVTEMGVAYQQAFDVVLQRDYVHFLNMYIASKDISNSYCEWLFHILDELEKRIDYNDPDRVGIRQLGLWAEVLFNVYLVANKLRVYEMNVCNIECAHMTLIVWVKKLFRKTYSRLRRFLSRI